ncbi:hypothetical protein CAPTEDRAFT_208398 [Capitella teleta]|uniref:Uncharacterized protein n=1 Tax=Capitella teleta TaxID=283909 RepID=R7T993_CAPTE|nr:hypothetical protein CAPTEDRAFT_208398 [Capitella teleta]|eukprot:ELT90008.1 hypothetical protein CAPTEDRAFT_208398 [Capitella teleta]
MHVACSWNSLSECVVWFFEQFLWLHTPTGSVIAGEKAVENSRLFAASFAQQSSLRLFFKLRRRQAEFQQEASAFIDMPLETWRWSCGYRNDLEWSAAELYYGDSDGVGQRSFPLTGRRVLTSNLPEDTFLRRGPPEAGGVFHCLRVLVARIITLSLLDPEHWSFYDFAQGTNEAEPCQSI